MDLNLTTAECLVHKQNITHTLVTNICSGETIEVAHGALDLFFGGVLTCIVIAMIGIASYAIYDMATY